ncbi:MAG: hypothetical protein B7Z75_07820 [Acidocella sp. 20-57-95]|nr:MAG: hypothetical protein B7Z75_07820 [Acidocella sp. 20-57-95]OYV60523.1 MAG: hypothetical protein B7Z71_06100 [Acidocella sp. 21-58-7]HQT62880.1 DUF1989 domain-containing protein [Acidocella sp.]HQU03915.1 DUF1989 domain-containing protein [Acidocella sp.]
MIDLDKLTPAEYRARYEALQEAARNKAANLPSIAAITEIPEAGIIKKDVIPPGNYVAIKIKRGSAIRITNLTGTPGAALFMWNAEDTSERYNSGDTVKLQWTTVLTTGRVLFSDMGRVLASITADNKAGHDSIIGPNSPVQTGAGRNGRDNLRLAAAKFGLTRTDVGPSISLFSKLTADENGRLHLTPPPAGAMVELRAEMNLLIALSNTPHALSTETQATGPISFVVYQTPPPSPDDLCRTFSDEAKRGFINTEEYFAA